MDIFMVNLQNLFVVPLMKSISFFPPKQDFPLLPPTAIALENCHFKYYWKVLSLLRVYLDYTFRSFYIEKKKKSPCALYRLLSVLTSHLSMEERKCLKVYFSGKWTQDSGVRSSCTHMSGFPQKNCFRESYILSEIGSAENRQEKMEIISLNHFFLCNQSCIIKMLCSLEVEFYEIRRVPHTHREALLPDFPKATTPRPFPSVGQTLQRKVECS